MQRRSSTCARDLLTCFTPFERQSLHFDAQVERMRSSGNAVSAAAETATLEQQLRSELASQRGVIGRLRQEAAAAMEAAEAGEARAAAAERDWQVLTIHHTQCSCSHQPCSALPSAMLHWMRCSAARVNCLGCQTAGALHAALAGQ